MKHKIFMGVVAALVLAGCRSHPNRAEKIDTKLESSDKVSGEGKVGVDKEGDMVYQQKVQMGEELRDLQNTVYSLEDQVYGTRKLGSLGLYGDLKNCLRKLSSKQNGGSGSLVWTEPMDRVTDKEEEFKVGLDEKQALVGVTTEYLKDRLSRFRGYKMILQKRHDEYESRIEECQEQMKDKKTSSNFTPARITEASKAKVNREEVNAYMCSYVKPGASLQTLMLNAFAKGWLAISDFSMDQKVTVAGVKDAKNKVYDNGFMFNGWKLAYDGPALTMGAILGEGKEARLLAWTYSPKTEVKDSAACLISDDGVWNM